MFQKESVGRGGGSGRGSGRGIGGAVVALLDADVVCHVLVAGGVVPEVVPVLLEDRVPVLHVGHAVLPVEVVGLVLAPVEPLDAAVEVGVPPVPVNMVAVVVLSQSTHPEEVAPGDPSLSRVFGRRVLVNQHRLYPVVQTNIAANFNYPTRMAGTQDLAVLLADLLHGEHEAVAASCAAVPMAALVPEPAVRAVMGVLACRHGGQEGDRSH